MQIDDAGQHQEIVCVEHPIAVLGRGFQRRDPAAFDTDIGRDKRIADQCPAAANDQWPGRHISG